MTYLPFTRDDFTSPVHEDTEFTWTSLEPETYGRIQNLSPDVNAEIWIACRGTLTGTEGTIIFQDKISTIAGAPGNTRYTAVLTDFDPELDPIFAISGYAPGSTITARIEFKKTPERSARLNVLALLPNPRWTQALLNFAVLGSFLLPTVTNDLPWVTLNHSLLGHSRLPMDTSLYSWQPITDAATIVEIERGITHNGISGQADLGTLTVSLFNGPNPRAIGLTRGTPIIAFDASTRSRLFTGITDRAPSLTRLPNGDHRYTITAVDTLSTLAAIKRYQLTPPADPWRWDLILDELLSKYGILWRVLGPAEPGLDLGPVMTESTITHYADLYLATNRVSWWIDRNGVVTASQNLDTTPAATITDRPLTAHSAPVLHHVAEESTFDSAAVVSTISFTNHSVELDEQGELRPTQTEISVRSNVLAATYGEGTATIETAALNPGQLEDLGEQILADYRPEPLISSARFTPLKHHHYDPALLDALTSLDLLDPIENHVLGETSLAHISRIKHTIQPLSWQTTLSLIERNSL